MSIMVRSSARQAAVGDKTSTGRVTKTTKAPTKTKSKPRKRHTITAARGVHKWNTEERKTIHLIFTELNLGHDDIAKLIHACFPAMIQVGYDADYRKFYDIWIGRNNASHSKEWVTIARPRPAIQGKRLANLTPYTAAELAEFARIRAIVHQVATANNIPIVLSTGLTSRELHPPAGVIIIAGPSAQPAPVQPAQVQPAAVHRPAPRPGPKRDTASLPKKPASNAPKSQQAAELISTRPRREAAVLTYREDSEEGDEASDADGEMDDGLEVEEEQDEEMEEEEEEQEVIAFYDGPISEPGYDLADIQGPRFRNAQAVQQRKPANTPSRLAMVHRGSLTTVDRRDGSTIVAADISQRFGPDIVRAAGVYDTDNDAYSHGGAALRVYFPASDDSPAHFADVMICDTTQCANAACQGTQQPYTFTSMTRSGKPFVHWEDCASDENGELVFFPDHVKGPTTITVDPAFIEEEDIIFHNGFGQILVQALVCSEGDCLRCNARKAAGEADEEVTEDDEEAALGGDEETKESEAAQ